MNFDFCEICFDTQEHRHNHFYEDTGIGKGETTLSEILQKDVIIVTDDVNLDQFQKPQELLVIVHKIHKCGRHYLLQVEDWRSRNKFEMHFWKNEKVWLTGYRV